MNTHPTSAISTSAISTSILSSALLRGTALALALIAGLTSAPAFAEQDDHPVSSSGYAMPGEEFRQPAPAPAYVAPVQVDPAPVAVPQAQPQRNGHGNGGGYTGGGRGNGGGQNYNRSSNGRYSQAAPARSASPVAYRRAASDWGYSN